MARRCAVQPSASLYRLLDPGVVRTYKDCRFPKCLVLALLVVYPFQLPLGHPGRHYSSTSRY